jgi:hypothetical protein
MAEPHWPGDAYATRPTVAYPSGVYASAAVLGATRAAPEASSWRQGPSGGSGWAAGGCWDSAGALGGVLKAQPTTGSAV